MSASLIDLKCRWLQSGLADLEKHQTFAFLCLVDFLRIFKIKHFISLLKDFLKSSEAHAEMVECILFHLNMVANTQ